MAYQWPQGCTHIQMPVVLSQAGTGDLYDLSNVGASQITLWMRPVVGNVRGTLAQLTGTVQSVVSPGTLGTYYFKFSPEDVANIGDYELISVISYGSPGDTTRTFPQPFSIVSAE